MCGNASGARHLRRDGFLESAGMMHALSTPPAPLLEHHRSAALEPECRHAAWQEIAHRWNDFEPAPDAPLQAELLLLGTDVTCLLGAAQSSAHEMHGGSPRALRDDVVVLSLLQAGGVRSSAYSRKGPGSLSLCDLRERHSYHWEHDTRQVFLTLPRQDAAAALGAEPTTRLLSTRCALAPALSSQMAHAALLLRQGGLDDAECAGLLEATRALALLTLRNLGRQGMAVDLPDAHETLHACRYVAALRFMGRPDEFEMVALDYCVTYEVSPPSWQAPRCGYRDDAGASPAAEAAGAGGVELMARAQWNAPGPNGEPSAPAPLVPEAPGLTGQVEGDATAALEALTVPADPKQPLQVRCDRLIRMDFLAAGSVLNWTAEQQAHGRVVQFLNLHRLVAVFFNVVGINEHAWVVARKD